MQTNLSIQEPYNHAVYQRDNSGKAFIPIVGTTSAGISSVKATFTAVKVGAVQTLEYQLPTVITIPVASNGTFAGRAVLPGGWYQLTLTAGDNSVNIERVGSGEVFVLFGHSFMSGGHDKTHQIFSTDERVSVLNDRMDSANYSFGQLGQNIGPMHEWPDAWGMLGDKLTKRLGVPVLFYGVAYGGSNVQQNYEVINSISPRSSLPPGTTDPTSRQPFAGLERVMQLYVPKTGVRAILTEHGYNDSTNTATFVSQFKNVFDYVRTKWTKPKLAIVLVQEQLQQYNNRGFYKPDSAAGLQQLLGSYPETYRGPNFNDSQWSNRFQTSEHLYSSDIDQFAEDWNNSISADFLSKSTPYLSESVTVSGVSNGVVTTSDPTFSLAGLTLKTADWLVLAGAGAFLLLYFIRRSKGLMIGFLLLVAFALGRLTDKG